MNKFLNFKYENEVDKKNMIVSFSIASDNPYVRVDEKGNEYQEILIIKKDAIDLTRLKTGAPLLKNHNADEILGVIEDSWIEGNKLFVSARFRKNSKEAVEIFKDIIDGTIKNVSVGYEVKEINFSRNSEGKTIGNVVKWMPFEASIVAIPADEKIGFRSIDLINKKKEKNIMKKNINSVEETEEIKSLREENEELKKRLAELEEENSEVEEEEKSDEDVEEENSEVDETEEEKSDEDVEEENSEVDETEEEKSDEDVEEEKELTEEEQKKLAKSFNIKNANFRTISEMKNLITKKNINKKEKNMNYSIVRAFQSLVNGNVNASVERAYSDELYRSAGFAPKNDSIMIRNFDGTTGAGLIGTEHRADLFTEMLKKKLAITNATFLNGLVGNVSIPVQNSTVSAEKLTTNAAFTAQDISVKSLTLTPSKIGAMVLVGKDLLSQGNPDAINMVIDDITSQIARKIELAIFAKIAETTGINTVKIATLDDATWKDFLNFGAVVEQYDNINSPYFIMPASTKQALKGVSKDAGSGRFIIEDNKLDGFDVNVSGLMSADEMLFGDFSQVIVGTWGGIEIAIDQFTRVEYGDVRIVASLLTDNALRNPEAFAKRVIS